MDANKHIRWGRVMLALLAVLLLIAGVVVAARKLDASQQQEAPSSVRTTPTSARSGSSQIQMPQIMAQSTSTPSPGPSASATGATNAPQWRLVDSNEFNGSSLGTGWGTYSGPHGGGRSYYSPTEVKVQNGLLQLDMEKKTTGGLPYTTGGVGAFHFVQTYGKYEMRVRLPYGKGVGPYAILWPQNGDPSAQVDIFESPPVDKSTLYFTNHGGPGGTSTQLRAHGQFTTGFHTLTCIWLPGEFQLLVDGVSQGILTRDVPHQPMWLGIAVESGDAFVGLPDASTSLPVTLEVDWVHIYALVK